MRNLLSAELLRLRKNKLFWACVIFSAVVALIAINGEAAGYHPEGTSIDQVLLVYLNIFPFAWATFSGLYLGSEYSDGTLRNKLIVGHSRVRVYLSCFIVNFSVMLAMCAAYLAVVFAVGIPVLGLSQTEFRTVLLSFAGSSLTLAVYSALFTMIGLLCTNKAGATVINLLAVVLIPLFLAMFIYSQLSEPEFYNEYYLINGEMDSNWVRNPAYVGGIGRDIYQFLMNFLPTGQAQQYISLEVENLRQMVLCALGMITVSGVSGICLFRRKDLK